MANLAIELISEEWFWVTGRGPLATFSKREWPFNPGQLNGQEIKIDHKRFKVRGVEHWAIHWRVGSEWPIGLLVEPLDDERSHRSPFSRTQPAPNELGTYEQIVVAANMVIEPTPDPPELPPLPDRRSRAQKAIDAQHDYGNHKDCRHG